MRSALSFADEEQIPWNVLTRLTKTQLVKIQTWSDVTGIKDLKLKEQLATFGINSYRDITPTTLIAIQRAVAFHETGLSFVFGNAESVIHSKGGSLTFGPETLEVQMPNQKPIQYDTSSGYPVEEPRPYMSGILAILSSNFQLNSGELKFTFDPKVIQKVFPATVAAFDPVNFTYVHATFLEVLREDSGFNRYVSEARSLSGLQFWDYTAAVLKSCSHASYIALHDTVCKRLLSLVEVKRNPQYGQQGEGAFRLGSRISRVTEDQKSDYVIKDTTVKQWPPSKMLPRDWADAVDDVEAQMGHRPFLLVGSIPTTHTWVVPADGKLDFTPKDAYVAYSTRRALHSSGSNGAAAVLASNGFSSIASNTSNRCVLLMTLAVNAIEQGCGKVDVRCDQNDLAYLEAGFPLVLPKHHTKVRYLLDYSHHAKVEVKLREFLISKPRDDAHYVAWIDTDVDSVPRGGDVATTLQHQWQSSVSSIPADCTVMLCVTSPDAFKDAKADAPQGPAATDVVEFNHYYRYHYVYQWRGPADFQGIYSSLPKMNRYTDVEQNQFVPLPIVPNWKQWLADVVSANARYATWFLAPRGFYSAASNLIRGIAKGTPMRFNDGLWEARVYAEPTYAGDFGPSEPQPPPKAPYVGRGKKVVHSGVAVGGYGLGNGRGKKNYQPVAHPKAQPVPPVVPPPPPPPPPPPNQKTQPQPQTSSGTNHGPNPNGTSVEAQGISLFDSLGTSFSTADPGAFMM